VRQQSTIARQINPKKFWLWRQGTCPTRPYRLWGREREVPRQPDGGWRMPSFLGGKSCGAFVQPAFPLAGNPMTTITFEEVFFQKLSLFSKMIQFDRSEVKN